MIEHLQLKNFKCFREHTIQFRGLTVLAGLNGAGKSSVIQAILAIYQGPGAPDGSALWRGPLVNLGSFRDVLHDGATDDTVRIEASFGDSGTTYVLHDDATDKYRIELSFGDSGTTNCGRRPRGAEGSRSFALDNTTQFILGEIYYLSADRLGPRPTLPYEEWDRDPATPLGKRGELVLWYLSHNGRFPVDQAVRHHDEPKNTLASQANAWLGVVSPGAELDVKVISEADCAVASYRFTRPADVPSRAFRAGNVGFGVSYALPLIVALLAPKQDRLPTGDLLGDPLVIIENPEAHIHPAGQTSLAELAAKAAAGGSQVILETHSDHVLNGVRLAVAEGILRPNQVAIHYFERTGLDVQITTPVLKPSGHLDVWPAGFFDQHERNLSRLIGLPRSSVE